MLQRPAALINSPKSITVWRYLSQLQLPNRQHFYYVNMMACQENSNLQPENWNFYTRPELS
jgi:hypothetical protein